MLEYLERWSDLITKTLRGNDSNLVTDTFIGLEVQSKLGIVPLNDDLGRLFDGFCANTTLKSMSTLWS